MWEADWYITLESTELGESNLAIKLVWPSILATEPVKDPLNSPEKSPVKEPVNVA